MGERFASFEGNRSYLMGAIAQIDGNDAEGAFATLTRCHGDIDPEGLSTPMDVDHPDYSKYQSLDRIVLRARDMIASDPEGARELLVSGLRAFGWVDESAAAFGRSIGKENGP
jgi:hypothetical protein